MKSDDVFNIVVGLHDSIDVKRCYIDMAGDLASGVMLSQIVYWHLPDREGNSKLRVEKDGYLWLAKNHTEWWDECRISVNQAKRILNKLSGLGLIITKDSGFGGKRTPHIRINETNFVESLEDVVEKSRASVGWKAANGLDGKQLTGQMDSIQSNTETTTETTTESNTRRHSYDRNGFEYLTAKRLYDTIKASGNYNPRWEKVKGVEALLQDWSNEIEKLIRLDGYEERDVEEVVEWLSSGNNWWIDNGNFLSAMKLRKPTKDQPDVTYFHKFLIQSRLGTKRTGIAFNGYSQSDMEKIYG